MEELLERLGDDDPVPGSGSAAALVLAMAASLVGKAARRSPDWGGAGGAAAQAASLRTRAHELAVEDAQVYREALDRLGRQEGADHLLAGALERAADVPLRIARAGADLAALAREVLERCDAAHRADVAGAAALAAGAADAAAALVETNLGAAADDPRVLEARTLAEAARSSAS
ncbi:MAG: cyclodeaminase/cyclohydrolase family protein [Gaiellaceae bacterium]